MSAPALKRDVATRVVVDRHKKSNIGTIGWFKSCLHRSKNEVFSEVKVVTPELAEALLTTNHDNRTVRQSKYQQLVSDMKEGRWTMNGEAIIFAKTGELNDGQHRLLALIEAKASLPMLFVFGVERETRTTIDQGVSRSAGDYLHMNGVPNGALGAAIARMLIAYEATERTSVGSRNRISAGKIVERVQNDITIQTSARYGQRHQRRMRSYANGASIGFCHNVFLSKNATEGIAFMEQLCLGTNLSREDPAFKAREKLNNIGHSSLATKIEIIFRAWNAYREKRSLTTIPVHCRLPPLV